MLDLPAAGIGSRVLARLVDLLALFVLANLLGAVVGLLVFSLPGVEQIAVLLVVAVVLLGYPVAFESLFRGRTPGKMAVGLRVVTREGGPAGFRHAALRGLIGLAEIFLTLGGVAVAAALATSRSQRFGDLAAGTIVVRERDAGRRALAVAFPPPPGYEAYCAALDVSAITDEQYGVIRSFLLRVLELTPGARDALAVRLANPTAVRMRHTPPPMLGPELFLACVASAYQVRHGGLLVPVWGVPSAPAGGWLLPGHGAPSAPTGPWPPVTTEVAVGGYAGPPGAQAAPGRGGGPNGWAPPTGPTGWPGAPPPA